MNPADIILSTVIEIVGTPTIEITDETVLYTQPFSGSITIKAPSGIIFYIGSDDLNDGNLSKVIVLPQNTEGFPQEGTYELTYLVEHDGDEITKIVEYEYATQSFDLSLEIEADGYSSEFTATDTTNHTEAYTRLLTITPPVGSSLSADDTTDESLTFLPNIWSGTWTVTLEITYTIAFSNYTLIQLVTLEETETVYPVSISGLLNAIETYQSRYEGYLGNNLSEASRMSKVFVNIAGWLARYNVAIQSGDMLSAYQNMRSILLATSDVVPITVQEIEPFDLDTITTYRRHTNLIDLGTKAVPFSIDASNDSRQRVTVSADIAIGIEGMSSNWSSTVLIDITASGVRTISWGVPDSVWVDGSPVTSIGDGETYGVSISTGGSEEANLLINWVKKS